MKSFAILRTNVGLTTNVKVVVDSKYGLSLDSIESAPELSFSKYKKFDFIKTNYYDELLPYFYDGLPAEIAYSIKYEDDSDSMSDNFASQYDEIYQYGARNIVSNKNYNEEYEYFAPLYVYKNKIPKNFIIFRVDNPGIQKIDRYNIRKEIFNNFKTVSLFDLTKTSPLGEWIDLNINDNSFYPSSPFDMSYTKLEFSQWNGIDYTSGGYVSKSQFLDDTLEEEKEIFEFEKFIFDGYRNNKVIFSNIINFSFLFDDTPADSLKLNKWSINRYYGFYLDDKELITSISPYITPFLKDDVVVQEGNILHSESGDPFLEGWVDNKPYYIEYENEYYKVEKFTEKQKDSVKAVSTNTNTQNENTSSFTSKSGSVQISSAQLVDINNPVSSNYISDQVTETIVDKWRIISKVDLVGKETSLNQNIGYINENNILINYDQSFLSIKDFDLADIWVIEIDGKYHNLVKNDLGYIKVNTDYSFKFLENDYTYYINQLDDNYTTKVSFLVDDNNSPKMFGIYRLKLSDIKDFDDRIVDTEPSKFEYEKLNELTETDESKLYLTNLNSNTNPKELDDFRYKEKVVNIPVSSEYTANQETFKIDDNKLSSIWRKNPVYCRWGFEGSISSNDYPYLLNNSDKFEDYNRTVNPFDPDPSRYERNLDYFYTINSSTYSYLHHTLHVENTTESGIDMDFKFDFDKYTRVGTYLKNLESMTHSVDYFTYFFTKKSNLLSNTITKNTKKYSSFIEGDIATPNITLFRGIKFSIYDVENVKLNSNNQIDVINMKSNNTFDDYKLSIIMTSEDNGMAWNIINKWEMDKDYKKNDIVSYDDILYIASNDTICTSPNVILKYGPVSNPVSNYVKSTPYNQLSYPNSLSPLDIRFDLDLDSNPSESNDWELYTNNNSILWNPNKSYQQGDFIYKDENYYTFVDNNKNVDFWNPLIANVINSNTRNGYSKDSVVIYNNEYYISLDDYNIFSPDNSNYWDKTSISTDQLKWSIVNIWNPSLRYIQNSIVVHNGVLYQTNPSNTEDVQSNQNPEFSELWVRLYSFEPDTDYVYHKNDNPIISLNNEYYMIVNNPNNKTLDNGINIYVNKIDKNILINIYINDNTTNDLYGKERDLLYTSLNKKLTATNFIDSLNNLSNKYGYTDFLKYIVINENGLNTYSYDNNIENLPCIIFAERPEPVGVKVNSLDILGVNIDKLKPTNILVDGVINNISELNYFNKIHIGSEILSNNNTPLIIPNYNGISPISHNRIYRFSGNYVPVFNDVSLFKTDNSTLYNQINMALDLSDTQNVIFEFNKDGNITEEIIEMYPGASFSNNTDFYKQIINGINDHYISSNIDFYYDISRIGSKVNDSILLNLDENSYDNYNKTWEDISSYSNDTSVLNPMSSTFSYTDLYPGNYINISNTNLDIINISDINIDNNSTYDLLVNLSSSSTQYFMGSNDLIKFGFDNDRITYTNYYDTTSGNISNTIYSESIVKPNTWYYLTFINDEINGISYQRIYIDGVDRTDSSAYGITGSQTSPNGNGQPVNFTIGASEDSSNFTTPVSNKFNGKITNIRIYDRLLSDDEIYTNFVNQHSELIVRYDSNYGDIKLELKPIYPSLTLNFIDYFDVLDTDYYVQFGATGGNPPYTWSINGSSFTTAPSLLTVSKGSTNSIVVKDAIGLTASDGYYTINDIEEFKYNINGDITY